MINKRKQSKCVNNTFAWSSSNVSFLLVVLGFFFGCFCSLCIHITCVCVGKRRYSLSFFFLFSALFFVHRRVWFPPNCIFLRSVLLFRLIVFTFFCFMILQRNFETPKTKHTKNTKADLPEDHKKNTLFLLPSPHCGLDATQQQTNGHTIPNFYFPTLFARSCATFHCFDVTCWRQDSV